MIQIMTAVAAALLIGACDKKEPEAPPPRDASLALPGGQPPSIEDLTRGARRYQEHCAQCHGPDAQGHPDWRNPQVAAAPPLDGTGNVWKRKKHDIMAIIKNGASRKGVSVMPAWKGRLSDQEIEDVITWFQALWPADMYDRWRKANISAGTPQG